jgi:hypothetical protein
MYNIVIHIYLYIYIHIYLFTYCIERSYTPLAAANLTGSHNPCEQEAWRQGACHSPEDVLYTRWIVFWPWPNAKNGGLMVVSYDVFVQFKQG